MLRTGLRSARRSKTTAEKIDERTMLIKELQNLQHQHGFLSREALHDLAERLKVPFFEVYGVASFYPYFRFEPPTGIDLRVCSDLSCHLAGAQAFRATLHIACDRVGLAGQVSISETSCLGRCDAPVAYALNDQIYRSGSSESMATLVQHLRAGQLPPLQPLPQPPASIQIFPYHEIQPFAALRQTLERRHFTDIIATLKDSGLRGMGGAGFPAGAKWE